MCAVCGVGSMVRPRTFVCVAMGSAVLFILMSRLLVYSAGSGVNRVFCCFVQARTLCRYGCIYLCAALLLVRM